MYLCCIGMYLCLLCCIGMYICCTNTYAIDIDQHGMLVTWMRARHISTSPSASTSCMAVHIVASYLGCSGRSMKAQLGTCLQYLVPPSRTAITRLSTHPMLAPDQLRQPATTTSRPAAHHTPRLHISPHTTHQPTWPARPSSLHQPVVPRPVQDPSYNMAFLDRVTVINRDSFQERVQCWDLVMADNTGYVWFTFTFPAASASYNFRDVSNAAFSATCNPLAPPPMPPLPGSPVCLGDAGKLVRYMRMVWLGGSGCATLDVGELQLWYNGYNIAYRKPAEGMGSYLGWPQYGPQQATDGRAQTFYNSAAGNSSTYLLVDLLVRRGAGQGCWARLTVLGQCCCQQRA